MDIGDAETVGTNRTDMPHTERPTRQPERSRKRRTEQNRGSEWPTVSNKCFKFYKVKMGFKGATSEVCQNYPLAGRLKHFLHNWEKLTQDQWILQTVKGVQIEFMNTPHQAFTPFQPKTPERDRVLLQEEITSMLGKGAIVELPEEETQKGFYSTMFLVPKKDGKMRPVINMKKLNQFVHTHHFKMEGIQTAREACPTKRLVNKNRPKGCLFYDTNTQTAPKISQVQGRSQHLPVHLPTVRSVQCNLGSLPRP